jgi:hypothetical protein
MITQNIQYQILPLNKGDTYGVGSLIYHIKEDKGWCPGKNKKPFLYRQEGPVKHKHDEH